jgi:hypothetical protein
MASAKQIGEFSLKSASSSHSPGPAGSVLTQVNWEGTATGFGATFGTATYVGGKSGTYTLCAKAYLDNGEEISGIGPGTYESTGKHQWHTKGFLDLSDGRRISSEGEMNLAERSWKGKIFETN